MAHSIFAFVSDHFAGAFETLHKAMWITLKSRVWNNLRAMAAPARKATKHHM
ncbi:hypothetical protein IMCC12053_2139 [Celeribacter marinus]|uniref:Uncharacterized protein n=1 Tax=Celeribacter marinus TaxID=1397108 RepID=A0A0N9ZHJ1_9RHOB|nr:hypothetical protein IMCC12053_2139 [Celeribacter marinus]